MFGKIKQERLLKEKLGRIGTYEVLSDGKIICKLDENKIKRVGYYNSPNNIYSLRLPTLFEIKIDNNLDTLNLTSIEYDMSDMTFDKEIYFYGDSSTTLVIKNCEFNGYVYFRCGILTLRGNIKLNDSVFVDANKAINVFNAELSHKGEIEKNFFFASPNTTIYNSKINLEGGYIRITKSNNIPIMSSTITGGTIHMESIYIGEFDSKIISTNSSIISCYNKDILTKIESPKIMYNNDLLTHTDIQSIKLRRELIHVLNDVRIEKYLELKERLVNDLRIIRDNITSDIEAETKDFENSLKNHNIKRFLYKKNAKN